MKKFLVAGVKCFKSENRFENFIINKKVLSQENVLKSVLGK